MLDRAPASPAQGRHLHLHGTRYYILAFLCIACAYGLDKLGLVDHNRLERDLSALLLSTLAVGERQQS